MLTAEFSGGPGLGGFSVPGLSTIKNAASSVASAAGSAVGAVANAGQSAAGAVKDGAGAVYDAAKAAAQYACSKVTNPTVQQGAGMAATYGAAVPGYGAAVTAAGQGTQAAGAICSMAYPPQPAPGPPAAPTRSISQNTIVGSMGLNPSIRGGLTKRPIQVSGFAKYLAGSIARFNVSRNIWVIYSPVVLAGLGCGCQKGFGDGEVTPAIPPGFVKAGEEFAPPVGVPQAGEESDKSLLKNPYFWLAVGGGALAIGGAGYALTRRKRRS